MRLRCMSGSVSGRPASASPGKGAGLHFGTQTQDLDYFLEVLVAQKYPGGLWLRLAIRVAATVTRCGPVALCLGAERPPASFKVQRSAVVLAIREVRVNQLAGYLLDEGLHRL